MAIYGIDVSKWQGNVDWCKVKDSGKVSFVVIRAGYGRELSQVDERFEEYYRNCKAQGLPLGCYWYSYATTAEDARREARTCMQIIKGKKFEYPILLDYEEGRQNNRTTAEAVIPAFMDEMQKNGYYTALYSYYSMLKYTIPEWIQKKYDIWVAHYASSTPYTGHKVWQYSCKGQIPGINGDCDLDVCYVDYPSLIGSKNGSNSNSSSVTEDTKTDESNNTENIKSYTLNNTNIYASSSTDTPAFKVSGKYYEYSSEVLNGRVRITNSLSNVGKEPVGKYVTGWIKLSDVTKNNNTSNNTPTKPSVDSTLKAGTKFTVNNAKIYASSSTNNATSIKSGTYYVYSSEVINNRIRVTNSLSNVGKEPVGKYVTGWMDTHSIMLNDSISTVAGTKLVLNNKALYSSSSSTKSVVDLNGTYYVYSSEVINNRIRVTNSLSNVGKEPVGKYVTGWINVK